MTRTKGRVRASLSLSACAVLLASAMTATGTPVAGLSDTEWDFGTLVQGQQTNRTVTLRNSGDAPLKILTVRGSCSACLSVQLDKGTIPPGGSAAITLSFDSRSETGRQNRSALIQTSDPQKPLLRVQVTGIVEKRDSGLLCLDPKTVDVGVVRPDGEAAFSLSVSNSGARQLDLLDVSPSARCRVVAAPREPLAPGAVGRIDLRFVPAGVTGPVEEFVAVRSDDPVTPTAFIAVRGYVASAASSPAGQEILIRPVGDPVRVLGENRTFQPSYEVVNGLGVPVSVAVSPSSSVPLRVEPDAAVRLDVPREAATGEVRIIISLPSSGGLR